MPEPTTKRPVTPGPATSAPVYETEVSFLELLGGAVIIGLSLLFAVVSLCQMSASSWGGQLTLVVFFLVVCVWVAFGSHSYHVYNDRLVVRYPLTFTERTTKTIPFSRVKEVLFNFKESRPRISELVVKTRSHNYGWYFSRDMELIHTFAAHLEAQGVKVVKKIR